MTGMDELAGRMMNLEGQVNLIAESMKHVQATLGSMQDDGTMLMARVASLENKYNVEFMAMMAAFTNALNVRGSDHGEGGRLREKEAAAFKPAMWNGEKGCVPFAEFTHSMHVYLSVLDQDSDPKEWLSWVLTLGHAPSKGELLAAGGKAVLLNRALYNVLAQCTSATSGLMVRQAGAGQGLAAWLALTTWFNPVRASDRASSLTMIMNPQNCKDIARLHVALEQWELRVADHESRFNVVIDGDVKIAALLSMLPEDLYNARFKGADFAEHSQLRSSLVSYMTSKRPTLQVMASHKGRRHGHWRDHCGREADS